MRVAVLASGLLAAAAIVAGARPAVAQSGTIAVTATILPSARLSADPVVQTGPAGRTVTMSAGSGANGPAVVWKLTVPPELAHELNAPVARERVDPASVLSTRSVEAPSNDRSGAARSYVVTWTVVPKG